MARVVHITHSLGFGGVERHLVTLSRASGQRHQHLFCSLAEGGHSAATIEAAGFRVYNLGIDPKRRLKAVFELRRVLREVDAQVVHCHGAEGNVIGIPAAILAGVPIRIAEEIGLPRHSPRARALFRLIYAGAHRIVAVSDAVKLAIAELGEAPFGKIERIYNPVEMPEASAVPRADGEPLRVAFVGRLEPVKNAMALVEALAMLPPETVAELVIVGDGSERSSIEDRARRLGVESRVTMTGFVSDPLPRLRKCHIYVQPSLSEGLGIALIEAMGCGLPVVASAIGGMPEIVRHGCNGWLLPEPKPAAIAAALAHAAGLDSHALARIGRNARDAVRTRFRPEDYIVQLEALYDSLGAAGAMRSRTRSGSRP